MQLKEDQFTFRSRANQSRPFRLLLWGTLILAGLWLVVQVENKQIEPLFQPAPTPTRTAFSWAEEAIALFDAGNLNESIKAYQEAVSLDPTNLQLLADLARIQTYSSALLTTDQERFQRLQEAMVSIDQAVAVDNRNSSAHAVRAFVLDWMANQNFGFSKDERERMLNQADQEATTALQLDPQNTLALVYLAEVNLDLQKWSLAQEKIELALTRDSSLMDVHRVHGQILETFGAYRDAIQAYEQAAKIAPNMTFLYIYIGLNYRHLKVYDKALEYFDKAASINKQINVNDPIPYIAIAKTYTQQGEFFIAAINAEKALELSPYDPNTYGQLGDIYVRARNYEGALPVLKCAVRGCTADENEIAKRRLETDISVEPLPLSSIEVAYYYLRYGSVLAALDRCEEAKPVLDEVMGVYGGDPVVVGIVNENRAICKILADTP